MPYTNEHSARLRSPGDFDKDSFRRTDGGTLYGKIKVPKTISIIWAKLKGKAKPSDPPLAQALRFPVKNWTASKAKGWLKKNNVKYILFEPAKSTEKQSVFDSPAPAAACVFNESTEVCFAKSDGDKTNNKFRIVGYSGGIIKNHFYWGNLAIDLSGTKFYKKPLPVLESHFTDKRIGFTTKQSLDGNVTVEGQFLENDNAQSLKTDMQAGFPMEASLFCPPTVIERVAEGSSVKVNGQTLKGPGAVFRKSVIKEVSICVFGADTNTKSSALADMESVKFSSIQENNIMSETTEIEKMSLEQLNENRPDLYSEVFEKGKAEGVAEGEEKQKSYFESLKKACGQDSDLLVQCFSEQKTAEEASQLRIKKLEDENKQLSSKKTEQAQTEAKTEETIDPAVTEFTDEATEEKATTEVEGDEENYKKEFAASKELQSEFGGDVNAYVAYKKADKAGQVRHGRETV